MKGSCKRRLPIYRPFSRKHWEVHDERRIDQRKFAPPRWSGKKFVDCRSSPTTALAGVAGTVATYPVQAETVFDHAPAAGFADLVERVMPSVISVEVKFTNVAGGGEAPAAASVSASVCRDSIELGGSSHAQVFRGQSRFPVRDAGTWAAAQGNGAGLGAFLSSRWLRRHQSSCRDERR